MQTVGIEGKIQTVVTTRIVQIVYTQEHNYVASVWLDSIVRLREGVFYAWGFTLKEYGTGTVIERAMAYTKDNRPDLEVLLREIVEGKSVVDVEFNQAIEIIETFN